MNKIVKYNEYQSVMKPIGNSHNPPKYDYKNIADVLGDKHHIQTDSTKIKEFEEKVISKMDNKDKPKNDDYYIKMYKEYSNNQSKSTPPHNSDTISNSDFGARAYADDVKMEQDNANESTINEDGVAGAVAGNVSGMGAVVTAQPASVPGATVTGDGTVGSGDIGAGQIKNSNIRPRPEKSRRKKKAKAQAKEMAKNMKNTFKESDYKKGGDMKSTIMPFSEFTKK